MARSDKERADDRAYYQRARAKILARKQAYRLKTLERTRQREAVQRKKHKVKMVQRRRAYVAQHPERAKRAWEKYLNANREKILARNRGYYHADRKKVMDRLSDPQNRLRYLAGLSFVRGKKRGLAVEVDFADVFIAAPPTECACCFQRLEYARGLGKNRGNYPSIDRIDNTKGYVKRNVAVICRDCNTAKRDYSIERLQQVLDYMKKAMQPLLRVV